MFNWFFIPDFISGSVHVLLGWRHRSKMVSRRMVFFFSRFVLEELSWEVWLEELRNGTALSTGSISGGGRNSIAKQSFFSSF